MYGTDKEAKSGIVQIVIEAIPSTPVHNTSKNALHLCLKRIQDAKNESVLRRLTQELQKIVFKIQYRNAES